MTAANVMASILSGLALLGALVIAGIVSFIFGLAALESGGDLLLTLVAIGLAALHVLVAAVALVLAIRGRSIVPIVASVVMAAGSGAVSLVTVVIGPAILFGLSGA